MRKKEKKAAFMARMGAYAGLVATLTVGTSRMLVEASDAPIDVTEYGACGEDMESDREAFCAALRAAGEQAGEGLTEVYVPDGTYYLDNFAGIYSGTWLHLADGAKIVRMDGAASEAMLIGVHNKEGGGLCYLDCGHYGYGQCENVLISGGEWSGGAEYEDTFCSEPSQPVMSFRHASGITIRDCSIGDTDGKHMLNFDGVSGITIEGVYFHDHLWNHTDGATEEDMKCREAIHTDFIYPELWEMGWTSAFPIEDLPCRDVLIQSCTFENCVSGVGTHNRKPGLLCEGFTVRDCEFRNIEFHCINAVSFTGMEITGNRAEDVSQFLMAHGCPGTNIVEGNDVTCAPKTQAESCIDICKGTEIGVRGNTIRYAGTHAVVGANFGDDGCERCSMLVEENEIINPGNTGIYVRDGCGAVVAGNRLYSDNGGTADRTIGIFVRLASGSCGVSGNEITGFDFGIEAADSEEVGLAGNSVAGAANCGISIYRTGHAGITGGNVDGCTAGIRIDASTADIDGVSMSENGENVQSYNGADIRLPPVEDESLRMESGSRGKETSPEENTGTEKKETPDEGTGAKQQNPDKAARTSGSDSKQENISRTEKRRTETVPIYRLFNRRTGEHFYTASRTEKEQLVESGWRDEGIGWLSPKKSETPVFRLYNPNNGEHHYTRSAIERDWLRCLGWRYEGICWYSDDDKQVPVLRHYHPVQKTGNHHYTTSKGESCHIINNEGWNYEGIGWYGAKAE